MARMRVRERDGTVKEIGFGGRYDVMDVVSGDETRIDPDILQENDPEALVQEVIDMIGAPVYGRVDAANTIILTGDLAAGTYSVKYEMEDGSTVLIGTVEV